MPSTLSPNMSLILPTVGQEPGPNWALDLNSSLSTVDQHDHSAGSGVQITPAGMNINTDLSFGSNNALSLRSVKMNSQVAPLALGADINCIYVFNGNLYYNDNLGNQVQITSGGAVAGTPGSIGNLIAPAAVTYVPGTQTFVFQSNQGNSTPASLDVGNLYLRNIVPAGNYIQLQPNAVLPASYSLTLPSALPASTKFVRLDNLGNLSATVDVDNSTLVISSNILKVPASGITSQEIADNAVITSKIANANVTRQKLSALGQQISSSCGLFSSTSTSYVDVTNLTVTITTTGRPVYIGLISDGTAPDTPTIPPIVNYYAGSIDVYSQNQASPNQVGITIKILRNGSDVSYSRLAIGALESNNLISSIPCSVLNFIDAPAAGTHTYKIQAALRYVAVGGTVQFRFIYCKLIAYEL